MHVKMYLHNAKKQVSSKLITLSTFWPSVICRLALNVATGAKVAEHQHLIHSDGEEPLETPKAERQRKEKTKTLHTFPCNGPCCILKRRDNPESSSTVRTASTLCSQCEQYNRSLQLCAKLEAHIVTCRKAQHRLAGRISWPKEKLTRRLMALDDIFHIVQAWDKSKPQKDRSTLQIAAV